MSTNIYEDILANINADKKAWCQGSWDVREDGSFDESGEVADSGTTGKSISRCLVSHVDLALGVSYVKPNGKRFVSKDMRKWRRRERVLAHLLALTPKDFRARFMGNDIPEQEVDDLKEQFERVVTNLNGDRLYTPLTDAVVTFNDQSSTTKANVRSLLKRAAKRHPED